MPRVPRFQAPDATWMGLADHANLAMLVGVALIGGCIVWQEDTRLRVETPTGGWQTFKDVQLNLTNPPTATTELFLVFRNRGSTQNLFNVNWFEVVGKGAAVTASSEATISASTIAVVCSASSSSSV